MSYLVVEGKLDSFQAAWEELLPSCSINTIFVTPAWQKIWFHHFGQAYAHRVFGVRNSDQLVGVAPLMFRDEDITFVGDPDLDDYHDFPVVLGEEEPFFHTLWQTLLQMKWSNIKLDSIPERSPTLIFLPMLARTRGYEVKQTQQDTTPITRLPDSWEGYLSGLRKKDRHELRRKLRRLEKTVDYSQYVCPNTEEEVERNMQEFFRLLKASSSGKSDFMTAQRERFFLHLATEFLHRKQFRLYMLAIGGVNVAACVCFNYADSFLLYNSGYDPQYSDLSVGLLNKALSIKDAITERKQFYNFLKGTERYKYNLGGTDEVVYNLEIIR